MAQSDSSAESNPIGRAQQPELLLGENQISRPNTVTRRVEEHVIVEHRGLSTDQLLLIEAKVSNERKSVAVAYLLWFFVFPAMPLGVHNFYLGKVALGLFQLFAVLLGAYLFWGGVFAAALSASSSPDLSVAEGVQALIGTLLILLYWLTLIVDLFLIPRRVRLHSQKLREQYTATIRSGSTG